MRSRSRPLQPIQQPVDPIRVARVLGPRRRVRDTRRRVARVGGPRALPTRAARARRRHGSVAERRSVPVFGLSDLHVVDQRIDTRRLHVGVARRVGGAIEGGGRGSTLAPRRSRNAGGVHAGLADVGVVHQVVLAVEMQAGIAASAPPTDTKWLRVRALHARRPGIQPGRPSRSNRGCGCRPRTLPQHIMNQRIDREAATSG